MLKVYSKTIHHTDAWNCPDAYANKFRYQVKIMNCTGTKFFRLLGKVGQDYESVKAEAHRGYKEKYA